MASKTCCNTRQRQSAHVTARGSWIISMECLPQACVYSHVLFGDLQSSATLHMQGALCALHCAYTGVVSHNSVYMTQCGYRTAHGAGMSYHGKVVHTAMGHCCARMKGHFCFNPCLYSRWYFHCSPQTHHSRQLCVHTCQGIILMFFHTITTSFQFEQTLDMCHTELVKLHSHQFSTAFLTHRSYNPSMVHALSGAELNTSQGQQLEILLYPLI